MEHDLGLQGGAVSEQLETDRDQARPEAVQAEPALLVGQRGGVASLDRHHDAVEGPEVGRVEDDPPEARRLRPGSWRPAERDERKEDGSASAAPPTAGHPAGRAHPVGPDPQSRQEPTPIQRPIANPAEATEAVRTVPHRRSTTTTMAGKPSKSAHPVRSKVA